MESPRRVAFVLGERSSGMWLGGINYHRTLLSALRAYGSGALEPVVFVGRNYEQEILDDFPDVEIQRTAWFERRRPERLSRAVAEVVLGRDLPLERALRARGISLLSHYRPLGRRSGFPNIGWIADFQHRHLPRFFEVAEYERRESFNARLCEGSTLVVLSSEDARRDMAGFSSVGFEKSRVLRFVVEPPAEGPPIEQVRARHGFRGPFLFLPNQFWVHKNHGVVLEAVARLRAEGREVQVIATGDTNDHRNPGYFEDLMARVRKAELGDSFQVLGRIPYAEMTTLMRAALAVVNPSLFEGWSTTVEESKSLGKRVVLSDIAVHREQDPPGAMFFDPSDADALARALWTVWSRGDAEANRELEETARRVLPTRRREFARTYEAIALEALDLAAAGQAEVASRPTASQKKRAPGNRRKFTANGE